MVAPIPKNTVPSTATTTAPAAPPPARPPATPPPASDVRRQAADDVHTLQRTSAPTGPSASQVAYQRSVDQAVRTYLEGGGAPLRVLLGQDGPMLSALANADDQRLERDLEASFERQATGLHTLVTGLEVGGVASIVDSVASDRIRLGILQEAQTLVNARRHDLLAMREALPELLPTLRNAQPGTAESMQARLLGIRGDAGDLQRAQQAIDEGLQGLETFMGRMRGQTWWEAGDFPEAAARSARRSNLGPATESVVAAGAARTELNEDVHHLVELAEGLHIFGELVEVAVLLAEGAAVASAATGAGVAIAALLAARSAYRTGVEAREDHLTLGRGLGL